MSPSNLPLSLGPSSLARLRREAMCRRVSLLESAVKVLRAQPKHTLEISAGVIEPQQTARLEEQLRQAQRMEAIGRLAGGVAHDFNNVLTAILGYTDLLLTRLAPGDPGRREAEEVKKGGEGAVALPRQLLSFGRAQAGEPIVLDLNDTIRGLEPMLRRVIRSNVVITTVLAVETLAV